jgi:general secretion pathway protein L
VARIIGLDLGTYSVKAVALTTSLRGYQIAGFWEQRLPPAAAAAEGREQIQAEAAKALMQGAGIHADTVVCGVPGAQALTRVLQLPFTDRRKIEAVVPFEVEEQIPYNLDEVVLDHQVVSGRDGASDVLVAAMRKPDFARLLEALKAQGIDPKVMCLDTLPFLYLSQQVLTQEPGPYAIVDLGHVHTSVSILAGGGLQYVRTISRGGRAVTEALSREFRVEPAEAEEVKHRHGGWAVGETEILGPEGARVQAAVDSALRPLVLALRQTFQAFTAQRQARVARIFLCGGTSRLRGIEALLAANLGVEVQPLQPLRGPFAGFAGPTVASDTLPKALALALRAVAPGRGPQLNLRVGEYGFRGDFQYLRGRVLQLTAGIVAILLLVGGYAYARYYTLSAYAERQRQYLTQMSKQTLGEEVTDFSVAHERITRGGERATLGALLPQTTALDYLAELSKNIGKEKIDVKRLDIGQKRITLEGDIDTIAALDAVVQSLSAYKCFEKQVRITKSGKNQLNNRANFQLLITPSC